jgi:hypothetical protein
VGRRFLGGDAGMEKPMTEDAGRLGGPGLWRRGAHYTADFGAGIIRKTLLRKIYVFRTNAALLCLIFPNSSFSRLRSLFLPPDKNTRISKNSKLFKRIIVHCRVNLFDLRQGNQ